MDTAEMRFAFPMLCIVSACLSVAAESSTVFSNAEIDVDFGGPFSVRIEPGSTVYRDQLPRPIQTVEFCRWQQQDPEVQQVSRPESGFLCELHLVHPMPIADWMKAIRTAGETKRRDRGTTRNLTFGEIAGFKVIQWRFQAGKTRLDHFILIGKKYHYLFVSSPYGSLGLIEQVLGRTRFH